MVKNDLKLTIVHDDNGSFADYSNQAVSFDRDTFSLTLVSADDYLYIGYRKPIGALYFSMATASNTDTVLTGEYFDANTQSFVSLPSFIDETKAFQRDGFIQWERTNDENTNEEATTVNGKSLFWYRFAVASDTTAITFNGVSVLFSDDTDLKKEFYEYSEFLPTGATSFILNHESARDEIIQMIRNNGRSKQNDNNGRIKDINAFDVLRVEQLNKASTYLVLSNIFGNVLNDPDGLYREKQNQYKARFNEAMDLFFLDLDLDDDGISDRHEEMRDYQARLIRR